MPAGRPTTTSSIPRPIRCNLNSPGGSSASVEYQTLNGDQFRQLNSSFVWRINPIWAANFVNKYSIDQNLNYETTLGLSYSHQCWGIKATYTDTPTNKQFVLFPVLKRPGGILAPCS